MNFRNSILMENYISHFCRILNKLTPDKFDKLCNELLEVGIETKYILKGVILLVSKQIMNSIKLKKRSRHFTVVKCKNLCHMQLPVP